MVLFCQNKIPLTLKTFSCIWDWMFNTSVFLHHTEFCTTPNTFIGGLAVVAFWRWRSPHGPLGSGSPRAGYYSQRRKRKEKWEKGKREKKEQKEREEKRKKEKKRKGRSRSRPTHNGRRAVGSIGPTFVWFPVLNQARATEDWDGCFITSPNKTARH